MSRLVAHFWRVSAWRLRHVPFVPLMSPCGRVREAFESFLRHSPRRDVVPASATSATDDYLLLHQIVEIASCGFHTTLVLKIGMPHAPQPPARAAKTSCFSLRHKRRCSAAKLLSSVRFRYPPRTSIAVLIMAVGQLASSSHAPRRFRPAPRRSGSA